MKYTQCSEQEFNSILEALGAASYSVSYDVGITHGSAWYQRSGKLIGTSRWIMEYGVRVFTHEISNSLYEAYLNDQ